MRNTLPFVIFEKFYNKSYFEAARRPRNRSLLDVNEDSEVKADAERALLESFYYSSVIESATYSN